MAALLTSVLDWSDKISEYIQAAREMGISRPAAGRQRVF